MKKIFLILFTLIIVGACVKLPDNVQNPADLLKVPSDFDWKTIKELNVSVTVTTDGETSTNHTHIIKIFSSPLLNSGSLIATGAATIDSPYKVKINIAVPTAKLYIEEIKPNGLVKVTPFNVTSNTLNVALSNTLESLLTKSNNADYQQRNASFTSPVISIPTGYDVVINDNKSLQLVGFAAGQTSAYGNDYKCYLIPAGFTRTAEINFGNWQSHVILFVQGTYNYTKSSANLNQATIVVLDGGKVTVGGMSNGTNLTTLPILDIKTGGSLISTGNVSLSGNVSLTNKGALSVSGKSPDFVLSNGTTMYNEGTLSVENSRSVTSVTNNATLYNSGQITAKAINLTSNGVITNDESASINIDTWYQSNGTIFNNHGEVVASSKFSNSGGGTVNNFCSIASNLTDIQGMTMNLESGSLFNTGSFKINSSTINMAGESMLLTGDITSIYGLSVNSSSSVYSLFKCTGTVPDLRYANTHFTGKIELVITNLTNTSLYQSSLGTDVILSQDQTKNIPGTTCNGSLGQIVPTDPGGGDEQFASYFPSATGWATYAFEDQWPNKGDYDLNDIVISFRVTLLSNSSNKVTEMHFNYQIMAVGAIKTLAAAFQLDNVQASNISSVTGQYTGAGISFPLNSNGTESEIDKAVVPLFNSAKNVVPYTSFLNTVKEFPYIPTSENEVVVKFATPVDQSLLTMNAFNFFISADVRGKEIHLPGYAPTSKFNPAYANGASLSSTDYFKYSDGMMWGLLIPESFAYPIETNSILKAYNHFAEWATSGGTVYTDWYKDIDGYRNSSYIY